VAGNIAFAWLATIPMAALAGALALLAARGLAATFSSAG
jgi:hypothetical protein